MVQNRFCFVGVGDTVQAWILLCVELLRGGEIGFYFTVVSDTVQVWLPGWCLSTLFETVLL